MEWVKQLDSSDWIAIINAFATLILSFFVYRSTNRASEAAVRTVELTEQTLLLNHEMNESKDEEKLTYRNSLKYQYVRILLKRSQDILEAITHADGLTIHRNLKNLEYKHNISPENLALCFEEFDMKLITDGWWVFEKYLEEHYLDVYPGNTINVLAAYADTSIDYFTRIRDLMDDSLMEIDH